MFLRNDKIKHEWIKLLKMLRENEPILRLVEVLFVVFGVIFVSLKANEIAEKELALNMLAIQPEFQIVESVVDSFQDNLEEANSIISISSLKGKYKEIKVDSVSFLGISYIYDGKYKNRTVEVSDYYRAQSYHIYSNEQNPQIYGVNNYKWYNDLLREILAYQDIDFKAIYIETYVMIEYVDEVNEKHVNYYRMSSNEGVLINETEGEVMFMTRPIYEKDFYMKELTLEKIVDLVE